MWKHQEQQATGCIFTLVASLYNNQAEYCYQPTAYSRLLSRFIEAVVHLQTGVGRRPSHHGGVHVLVNLLTSVVLTPYPKFVDDTLV